MAVVFQSGTLATPPVGTTPRTRLVAGSEVQSIGMDAPNATVAAVSQDAVSPVTLLAANANRQGFVIQNDDENRTSTLFVKFGAAASLTDFTRSIPPGETWERSGGYTGIITGIWDIAGIGKARCTEETL